MAARSDRFVPTLDRVRVAIAVALILVAAVPGAQARTARPDLRVTTISVGAGEAVAGGSIEVGDATRNSGRRGARTSTTTYFISQDRRKSAGDFKLGSHKVGKLRRSKSSRRSAAVQIPPSIAPGAWFVIACADSARRVRESNERNNCRTSAMSLIVRGQTPPAGGQNAPVVGGCQIFPADNPWNRDISQDPVDP